MCGIAGFSSKNGGCNKGLLIRMSNSMLHRGPDDSGYYLNEKCTIGISHRRLSIIDLTQSGHQPMADDTGRYWIVFNGELYNYKEIRKELVTKGHTFRSQSDTEVLLESYRAWGINCLSRLNGMFAFAIYDSFHENLFLARDRAGEKPLYYYHNSERLWFASELKALLENKEIPRILDQHSLEHYLCYGYVPGAMCILKGVQKVPSASYMQYDIGNDRLTAQKYWNVPNPVITRNDYSIPTESLVEGLHEKLKDSIRLRLVADVPIGILLSGGIDSSLIAALAAEASSSPIRTFTITFPGYKEYDEAKFARLIADHFGTVHQELPAEPVSVDLLPELAAQFDEPIADSSMVPMYLVSKLIRQHATVALSGDGGDELFGGYLHHQWIQKQETIRRFIPSIVRRGLYNGLLGAIPPGIKGRNFLLGCCTDLAGNVSQINIHFDKSSRRKLLSKSLSNAMANGNSPEHFKAALCKSNGSALQCSTLVDFLTYLPEDILVKVDRASMLASLEVRSPFLDHQVVEFAFNKVPDNLKTIGNERKILLRLLSQRLLPTNFDFGRKQGFSLPLQKWFKGKWGTYCEEILYDAPTEIFNKKSVCRLIKNQKMGLHNTQRIFMLTIFELWRRRYSVTL